MRLGHSKSGLLAADGARFTEDALSPHVTLLRRHRRLALKSFPYAHFAKCREPDAAMIVLD
jgi:hypothetical protein